jgi:hypothetical protein
VKKKGRAVKDALVSKIREACQTYSNVFVFDVENMKNSVMKDVREEWKGSKSVRRDERENTRERSDWGVGSDSDMTRPRRARCIGPQSSSSGGSGGGIRPPPLAPCASGLRSPSERKDDASACSSHSVWARLLHTLLRSDPM